MKEWSCYSILLRTIEFRVQGILSSGRVRKGIKCEWQPQSPSTVLQSRTSVFLACHEWSL